jgi:predicted permease
MNPIRRLLKRRQLAHDLTAEIAGHIEQKVQDLMAEGKSEDEARHLAVRAFGNTTVIQEGSREAWGWNTAEELWNDLRYAARILMDAPAFTATAVIVLALGIGMNTAIFSAVKAVLLSRLPYPEPERLVILQQTARDGHLMNASGPDARDWRTQNTSFAWMATYDGDSGVPVAIAGEFRPRRSQAGVVSEEFFRTLGVQPLVGRTFSIDERKQGGRPAALVSYDLAAALFGTPAAAMNRVIRMDGLAFTIIGIMPPSFEFPSRSQLWISQEAFGENNERSAHNYHVIGRLKPDVTLRSAQADMDVIAARLGKAYPDDRNEGIRVTSLRDQLAAPFRPVFLILLSAVTCVLLVACANTSNLQLARSAARVREMALRTALGAARFRLIRQLLTESVLLALTGGAAGLLLAVGGCSLLRYYAPQNIPGIENIRIDPGVLAFTMILSLSTGVLFGLAPALAASRIDVNEALKDGSAKSTLGPRLRAWGKLLVVTEVGLAVVLLAGAALLVRSLWNLDHVDSGLHSSGVFTTELTWPTADGNTVDAHVVAHSSTEMLERIRALRGIEAAGLINSLPVQNSGSDGSFEIEGTPLPADPHDYPDAWYRTATAGYFTAFGLPVLSGRNFTEADDHSPNQVALVNRTFAKKFFKTGDVLGRRIKFLGFDLKPQFMTIIGIVPDVHAFGLNRPADAEVFADYFQHAGMSLQVTLVVRGVPSLQNAVRGIIRDVNRDSPVDFAFMDTLISASLSRDQFQTALLSLFAGFGLLLAAVGIYGVLSYTVTRRTAELGIRMALGARQRDVLSLVLREGLSLAMAGLALGIVCALLATRALSSLLYGISPTDPGAFLGISLVFACVALLGCYIPARRAAKIDPNIALRYE